MAKDRASGREIRQKWEKKRIPSCRKKHQIISGHFWGGRSTWISFLSTMTMISSNLEHNCYWMWLLKFSQLSGQLYQPELDFILSSKPSEIPRGFLLKLLSRQMTFINCVASWPKFGVLCLSLLNVHGVAKSRTQLIDFPFPCWMYSITSSLFLWLWVCIYFSDLLSTVSSTNLISMLSGFFFFNSSNWYKCGTEKGQGQSPEAPCQRQTFRVTLINIV